MPKPKGLCVLCGQQEHRDEDDMVTRCDDPDVSIAVFEPVRLRELSAYGFTKEWA